MWSASTGEFIKQIVPDHWISDYSFEHRFVLTRLQALSNGYLAVAGHWWTEQIRILNTNLNFAAFLLRDFQSSYQWTRGFKSIVGLDDEYLVSASKDWTVSVWKYERNASKKMYWRDEDYNVGYKRTFSGHSGDILSLVALPGGHLFASGGEDSKIKIWHRKSGLIRTIETQYFVYSLLVLRDGSLLSGEQNGLIQIWNPYTSQLLKTISEETSENKVHLAVLNDGRLVSALVSNEINILKINQIWISSQKFSTKTDSKLCLDSIEI